MPGFAAAVAAIEAMSWSRIHRCAQLGGHTGLHCAFAGANALQLSSAETSFRCSSQRPTSAASSSSPDSSRTTAACHATSSGSPSASAIRTARSSPNVRAASAAS